MVQGAKGSQGGASATGPITGYSDSLDGTLRGPSRVNACLFTRHPRRWRGRLPVHAGSWHRPERCFSSGAEPSGEGQESPERAEGVSVPGRVDPFERPSKKHSLSTIVDPFERPSWWHPAPAQGLGRNLMGRWKCGFNLPCRHCGQLTLFKLIGQRSFVRGSSSDSEGLTIPQSPLPLRD
jgi:hypothetical protein